MEDEEKMKVPNTPSDLSQNKIIQTLENSE